MVVYDLDIIRIATNPSKTDTPLFVDTDTVLPSPRASKLFQPIAWRNPKIVQRLRRIENDELSQRRSLNFMRELLDRFSTEYFLRSLVTEALDHAGK